MRSLIAALFFSLAAWFVLNPASGAPPIETSPKVDPADLSKAPLRTPLTDPPMVFIGGVDQRCSDCHAGFESLPATPDVLHQHGDLVHDHGMNDRCFNCHDRGDRNRLVLQDGSTLEFKDAVQLCTQCHGTVYRDWSYGMHGRTQGSWDPQSPEYSRLTCIECHDPHAPAYDPIAPLPAPRTFRMGNVSSQKPHTDERNPLRRRSHPTASDEHEE